MIIEADKKLIGHKASVYALAKCTEFDLLSACAAGVIAKWTPFGSENGKMIAKSTYGIFSIFYDKINQSAVIGQNYAGIRKINLKTKKSEKSIEIKNQNFFDIKRINNQYWVASSTGTLYILDVSTLQILEKHKVSNKSLRSIVYIKSKALVFIGCSDNHIYCLSALDVTCLSKVLAHNNSVFCLAENEQRGSLISGSRDAKLKEWLIKESGLILEREIVGHMYTINDVCFSNNFEYFATCSMDKTIKIWRSHDFRLLKVIDKERYPGHGTSINQLMWLNNDQSIAACSDDNSISIWHIKQEA